MLYRLWIDGACSGNPGPGGYAALVFAGWPDHLGTPVTGHAPHTTNNAMELMALIVGLHATPAGSQVLVVTDSANVIGWLRHGWKRRDGGLRPLLAEADRLIAERTVDFEKVAGHMGHRLNEDVDGLARGEAERAKTCSCASHDIDAILGESPAVLGALNRDILARGPELAACPHLFAGWPMKYTTLVRSLLVSEIQAWRSMGASSPVAEELLRALDAEPRVAEVPVP